ncbi:calnexin-like, partial [Centruroides sculpturatus]|uniref:calnexin-like n=1 Tax=Centruroides sculpturatus TaxID=218467 RepID=UPI000C6E1CFF
MKVSKGYYCVIALILLCTTLADDIDDDVTVEEKDEVSEEKASAAEEILYTTPRPIGNYYLAEHFDDREDFSKRWIISEAKKDGIEENIAKYNGKWEVEETEKNGLNGDLGLVLKSKAHHHAISTRLDKPFLFDNKPFVLQYEVHFQNGQDCGGAYIKVLSQTSDMNLKNFHDKTPYTIMFGPDKCGTEQKLHFIFRHRNPKNGTYQEKHWKRASSIPKLEDLFKDKKPHLFTLIITPDNRFEIQIDQKSIHKGSLLEDVSPSVNPPAEIDDPNDSKPEDWDEREKIPDPNAKKPDNWDEDAPRQIPDPNARKPEGWLDDEVELIPDPNAEKPKDWDDEMDGEWEPPLISNPNCEQAGCGEWKPPMIDNPNYKGKWRAPLIDNPNYKGKWKPRRIENPEFFEDKHPYRMTPVGAVGFELWSMTDNILFDNIIITDDMFVSEQWAAETWVLKKELVDRETDGVFLRLVKYTNKHPWLWAVYVIVIGLPIVLFISFCCTSSTSQEKKEEAIRAKRKKTDEPTPDDIPASEVKKEVRETTPIRIEEVKETEIIPESSEQEEKSKESDVEEKEEELQKEENTNDVKNEVEEEKLVELESEEEEEEEEEEEDDDDKKDEEKEEKEEK